jgi:hypothetical protein
MLEADLVFFHIKNWTSIQTYWIPKWIHTWEEIIQIYTNMGTKTVLQMSYPHLHFNDNNKKKKKTQSEKWKVRKLIFIYFSELGASEINTIRFMADSKIINIIIWHPWRRIQGVCVYVCVRERESTIVLYDLFAGTKGCPVIDILKNRSFK